MSGNLERRYRGVLRLLPRWYRAQWEQDMVTAFLDGWLTGDPAADEYISRVTRLAGRLYLTGPATPRRYAWGQALRRAVLAVMLVHAVVGVDVLVFVGWSPRLTDWLPAVPGSLFVPGPGDAWYHSYCLVSAAWIVILVTLALGRYRTARILSALAGPGPGHDRVPPGRSGGRGLVLAGGPARRLPRGVRAADGA